MKRYLVLLPIALGLLIASLFAQTTGAASRYTIGLGPQPHNQNAITLGRAALPARMSADDAIAVAKSEYPGLFTSDHPVNIEYGAYDPHYAPKGQDGKYHPLGIRDMWVVRVSGLTGSLVPNH